MYERIKMRKLFFNYCIIFFSSFYFTLSSLGQGSNGLYPSASLRKVGACSFVESSVSDANYYTPPEITRKLVVDLFEEKMTNNDIVMPLYEDDKKTIISFFEKDKQEKTYCFMGKFPPTISSKDVVDRLNQTNLFGSPDIWCVVTGWEEDFEEEGLVEEFFNPFDSSKIKIYQLPEGFHFLYVLMDRMTGELSFKKNIKS